MFIPATCPFCAASYVLNEALRGKTVRCRQCQTPFVVGAPKARDEEAIAGERSWPSATTTAQFEDDVPAPPRRRRSRSRDDNTVMRVILIVGGVIGLLILLTCGSYFLFIWRITKTASDVFAGLAPPKDVSEALTCIKTGDFRRNQALDWLARTQPDERRRAEVARAVEPLLEDRDVFVRGPAANVLAVWGTSESVPLLLRALDDEGLGHAEMIQALGKLRDPRAAGPLARRLSNFGDRSHASKALRELGPVAEPEVLKCLQHRDAGVRTEACKILKYIGSQQSVPALREAARDPNPSLADEAQAALDAITQRR